MPLVKNASIDGIQLRESSQVNVRNDSIENEIEVLIASKASVGIMEGCDAIEVVNILTDGVENLVRVMF